MHRAFVHIGAFVRRILQDNNIANKKNKNSRKLLLFRIFCCKLLNIGNEKKQIAIALIIVLAIVLSNNENQ